MAKKRAKVIQLKDEVYIEIRHDIPLRTKIANALNIENNSVYASALRKSPKFTLPFILDIISKHIGKSKNELLLQD